MGRLAGKVALISGVARGQGRSHALKLASEGANIVGFDVCEQIPSVEYPTATEEDLNKTVELVEALNRPMIGVKADVRDLEAVSQVAKAGCAEFGRIDIIIANAGIMPITGSQQLDIRAWHDSIDVMLTGVFNTVVASVDSMLEDGRGGSIIITSSTAGLKGLGVETPGALGYTAAKHGVVGLMRAWANAFGPRNIRVNTIHPTGVSSPMIMNEAFERYVRDFPKIAQVLGNALPVELIDCEDVSNAVAFLASDEGRYITGQTLGVDAGAVVKW
jgi:SDR family mycofactocin-dependent oxidoreductase